MSLALLKSEVLSVLADAYDEAAWSDATLEEALRQALMFFHPYALARETTFTLLEDGYEHNVSSLNAHEILSIGYPWGDGYRIEEVARHWRMVGQNVFRIDDLDLGEDEDIRVEYRPRHTIEFLDGAEETTFWEIEQRRFVLAAGAYALKLRAMLYAGSSDEEQRARIGSLMSAHNALMAQFLTFEMPQASSSNFVTWGPLGLCG